MTKEEFITKSKALPYGDVLDHSKVEWHGTHVKVLLVDRDFGEWLVFPYNRLKGQAHPQRRANRISSKKSMTREEFIKRAEQVHEGEGLDYSKVEYVNMRTKVCIIDPEYGEYYQEPSVHLKGCGHPLRGKVKVIENNRYTTEKFVKLATSVWGGEYDFSNVNYKSSQEKVEVICEKHGSFMAYPDAILQGKGCPKCGNHRSDGEDEIYALCCDIVGSDNVIRQDRSVLGNCEIDIFIPSMSLAIEYDGLRWHSERFGKDRNYHLSKTERCSEKGIRLIHVFEDEWVFCKEIVKSKIKRILGDSDGVLTIGARKCRVSEIKGSDARFFLDSNHVQGYASATVYLGAYFSDVLVGVMSFVKCGDGKWNLNRFAVDIRYRIVGLASKLFKWFTTHYNAVEVKSFLDRRWGVSEGSVYDRMGFQLEGVVRPSYWYTDGHLKRIHKFLFRKNKLIKKGDFNDDMKESDMAKELGYDRIWDCGLFKYVWRSDDFVSS